MNLSFFTLAADTAAAPVDASTAVEPTSGLPIGDLFAILLMLAGVALCALSAIGILRMPDLYTRMQAAAKAGTLGVACIILATAAHFGSIAVAVKVGMILVFIFLTTPAAAHLIARAAYFVEVPIWKRTGFDDLHGCYTDDHRLVNVPQNRAATPIAEGEPDEGNVDDSPARATG
ncbi:MAG: monovalent cation/H(+) antiporter subunit G [Planctomycetota bacterium]